MTLADMMAVDEDALICDLAETYGIVNFRALPVKILAALCVGLREDSRIKMKIANNLVPLDTLLLASALDRLSFLAWAQTKDAQKGRNRPKPVLGILLGKKPDTVPVELFETGDDFERERKKIIERMRENGDGN